MRNALIALGLLACVSLALAYDPFLLAQRTAYQRLVGGVQLWTPADLGDTVTAWYDADSLDGTNTQLMTTWTDISGNTKNATTASGTAPQLILDGQNSKKVLRFGGSQFYSIADSLGYFNYMFRDKSSFFIVAKQMPGDAVRQFYLDNSSGGAARGITYLFESSTLTDGLLLVGYNNTPAAVYLSAYNQAITTNQWNIVGHLGDALNATAADRSEAFINAVSLGKPSTATAAAGTGDAVLNMHIARNAGSAVRFFTGDMGEIIIADTQLSTADRQRVEGYLAHKWGLTANLPEGHPYEDNPPTK